MTNRSFVCKGGASDSEEIQVVLRRRAPLVIGAVTALCLSAVACTPSGPTTPSPTPTPYASPTETKLERQTRLDFEAAEKAYRTFSAEYDRLANAGGAKQPSNLMKKTGGGPLLVAASDALQSQLAHKERTTGRVTIVWAQRGGYSPTQLSLDTCEDGSGVRVLNKKGQVVSKGSIGTSTVEARKENGSWRAWDLSNSKDVPSCER